MDIRNHNDQPLERWREGVMTVCECRSLLADDNSASSASSAIPVSVLQSIFMRWVIEGTAEIQLGKERAVVTANQSVLIPAGVKHGFRNLERATLRGIRPYLLQCLFS
jgi:Cupin domain